MAVAFDAVGPTSAGQVSTVTTAFTWTHTAGTGGSVVVVFLTAGLLGGGSAGALGSYASVTYGGNAMTLLSSAAGNNSTFGGILMYGITGQANGANTVSVGTYTPPSGATFSQTIGVSLSFTGATRFGTAATPVVGSAATGSIGITGTTAGGVCVAGACDGSGVESVSAGTQRFLKDQNSSSMGNTVGATLASPGGTGTISFAWANDLYAILGVEVSAAAAGTVTPPSWVQRVAVVPFRADVIM